MPELRRDPLSGEWVIIAGERRQRPQDAGAQPPERQTPPYVADCPFCPGNEEQTPPEVFRAPSEGEWQLRGFPNKYAVLTGGTKHHPPGEDSPMESPLFLRRGGGGAHEVLVESRLHSRRPVDWTLAETQEVVQAYQDRFQALWLLPATRYVLLFKNHGREAGASLEHPHSQLLALPVVPERVERKQRLAEGHYANTEECLSCAALAAELQSGGRIVHQDGQFVVFCPFASTYGGETWVMPIRHEVSFAEADNALLQGFAIALGLTLQSLERAFGDLAFNYALHSTGPVTLGRERQHWYLQVIPRLGKFAAVELAAGAYVNNWPPEETAALLRLGRA